MNLSSDMAMSKTFNVADLYEYHPTEHLYLDYNSRTSSFEDGGTDIGDQGRRPRQRTKTTNQDKAQVVDRQTHLSTD